MSRVYVLVGLVCLISLSGLLGCGGNNPVSPVNAAPGTGGDITEEQAIQIALNEVDGKVVETEFEEENGVLAYGVEIETNSGTKEVTIDPQTGEVISVEDDDDDKFLGIF